jgi:uncharacterized Zn finger protein
MDKTLSEMLNNDVLIELAGERAFERGVDYFEDGHVVGLKESKGTTTARVRGTYYYRVKLWAEDGEVAFDCNCPVGHDDVFCKHCVAVGLAWLEQQQQKAGVRRHQTRRNVTDEEIREHLVTQDKASLVELLMNHTEWDSDFRDRLVLTTAQRDGNAPDLAVFRGAIDKAIRHRDFVHYTQMPEYARGIEAVVDSLSDLLKRGHATEARELTEHALKQMESAMNGVDDSDGFMGGILDSLQELHLAACRKAKPEPKALAKFLFGWEIASDWEIFLGAAGAYADVLGKEGLAEYRKLAETKWAKVPPLAPGEKDPERYSGRWRITHIMETLAERTGDVEALVAVKSRDLSLAFGFLEIAQIYKAAGNNQTALEWAERGARAFPAHTDGRLRKFLIDEYHRRGRHDEAITIAWTSFCEHPRLDAYQGLHHSALHAKKWPRWREKALTLLREEVNAQKKQSPKNLWGQSARPDRSDLVEIYLWEGDIENAWTEAKTGSCSNGLWFRLAEARAKDHPEDAIAVYSEQLKPALQLAQQSAYEEAVDILGKIQKLMVQLGKKAEFASLVQSVRAQYKPRRNLMKLLDAQGWS